MTGASSALRLRTAHTSALDGATLAATRALLRDVFGAELTDDDVEHCLGGIHALAHEHGELVGHAAVVQRRMLHGGRTLRAGYVEGVAVRADRRRRGVGGALMRALDPVLPTFHLAALCGTDAGIAFYEALGWQPWRGALSALTPAGIVPSDELVHVRPLAVALDLDGELTCDWREGELW